VRLAAHPADPAMEPACATWEVGTGKGHGSAQTSGEIEPEEIIGETAFNPLPEWRRLCGYNNWRPGIFSEALRPILGPGYIVYGLLLPIWFIAVGWKLYRLGSSSSHAREAKQLEAGAAP
jgi:hypothetical protein